MTDDPVPHFYLDHLDRDAGAGWRYSSQYVLKDQGMDGGAGDGDVLFAGGQHTLENIRVWIDIGGREEIGVRRRSERPNGEHHERSNDYRRMACHGLGAPGMVRASCSALINASTAGRSW